MCYRKVEWNNNNNYLKVFFVYDAVLILPTVVFGMWRANEFLYLNRLGLWSLCIPILGRKILRIDKKLFSLLMSLCFFAWYIFRVAKEWDDLKIMPYSISFVSSSNNINNCLISEWWL